MTRAFATDVANALVNADLHIPAYGAISAPPAPETPPPLPTLRKASPIYTVIWMTSLPRYRGGTERQHQLFDSTVCALKWPPPLLPGEANDSESVNNILAREGDWECVKEVLKRIIDTEAGTIALPERKLQELWDLLDIPTSQRRMGRKELELLVGKLRSIHLAVPGAVAHLYHIQHALSQAGTYRAWLYPDFHRKIAN